MKKIPKITIIGLGALGTVLCRALALHEVKLTSLFNRTPEKARELSEKYGVTVFSSFPEDPAQLGSVVFLTVPDAAIAETAGKLTATGGDFSEKIFVHCSGNESASVLDALKKEGARTASMHPLQTFNRYSTPADFSGIYFSLQGDSGVFPLLGGIAGLLGAQTLSVNEQQKSCLHAAAVIASNYLITLLDASMETGSMCGMDNKRAREVLHPLIQTTLENFKSASFKEAISGPIARGDIETAGRHLQLLEHKKELHSFYSAMGLKTTDKVEEAGMLEQASADAFRELFQKQRDQ